MLTRLITRGHRARHVLVPLLPAGRSGDCRRRPARAPCSSRAGDTAAIERARLRPAVQLGLRRRGAARRAHRARLHADRPVRAERSRSANTAGGRDRARLPLLHLRARLHPARPADPGRARRTRPAGPGAVRQRRARRATAPPSVAAFLSAASLTGRAQLPDRTDHRAPPDLARVPRRPRREDDPPGFENTTRALPDRPARR